MSCVCHCTLCVYNDDVCVCLCMCLQITRRIPKRTTLTGDTAPGFSVQMEVRVSCQSVPAVACDLFLTGAVLCRLGS